ncbi:MAG: glycerophosphoryl diester phosphodiesterase membrane domain-containing protein [Erysipelotrichaceae bacterium]|nr:glycerophosphoryl diester phosphodiesterase membrane domain-containing protein [Erysipelotrichaceae bacterium]
MKLKQSFRQNYLPYVRSVYDISRFQICNGMIIWAMSFLLRQIAMILIRSTGRVAISTGDFSFLFTTWQGPLLLFIGLSVLFVYLAFDLNSMIIFSDGILKGEPKLFESLKQGFLSIRKFFTPDGIGIVMYIALVAPIVGFGFTISLTDSLYLPNFISSVIDSTPLYSIIYHVLTIIFILLGIIHIFILHGILLGNLPSYKADDQSRKIMKDNYKDFFKNNLYFLLRAVAVCAGIVVIFGLIPGIIATMFVSDELRLKTTGYFILFTMLFAMLVSTSYFHSFYMLDITRLYYRYTGKDDSFRPAKTKRFVLLRLVFIAGVLAGLYWAAFFVSTQFDQVFTTKVTTGIIAHRAGGTEAPENTVAGIEKAIALGAYGAEIDIQRTKDGYYIINHDGNFTRLCSNKARPEELTLDEVKDLVIRDPLFPDQEEDVATFEEMLDASKDRIVLFVELKGNTADQQMGDDAIRMIKERGMEKQCVLISLKYSLIDYIERNYPEMETAYLTFASFGDTAKLNCDYLGLEEEACNSNTIDAIHDSGRKVLVWTPNSVSSQRKFLNSKADYIITDNISQANEQIKSLNERQDYEVILDWIFN